MYRKAFLPQQYSTRVNALIFESTIQTLSLIHARPDKKMWQKEVNSSVEDLLKIDATEHNLIRWDNVLALSAGILENSIVLRVRERLSSDADAFTLHSNQLIGESLHFSSVAEFNELILHSQTNLTKAFLLNLDHCPIEDLISIIKEDNGRIKWDSISRIDCILSPLPKDRTLPISFNFCKASSSAKLILGCFIYQKAPSIYSCNIIASGLLPTNFAQVFSFLNWIIESKVIIPNPDTFKCLFNQSMDLVSVRKLIQEASKYQLEPDHFSLWIMEEYLKNNKISEALDLYNQIHDKFIIYNTSDSFACLLFEKALVARRLEPLLDDMIDHNWFPPAYLLSDSIFNLTQTQPDVALKLLITFFSKSSKSFQQDLFMIVRSFIRLDMLSSAVKSIRTIESMDMFIATRTLSVILEAMTAKSQFSQAQKWIDSCFAYNKRIHIGLIHHLAGFYFKALEWNLGEDLLNNLTLKYGLLPNTQTYKLLMNSMVDRGLNFQAVKFAEQVLEKGGWKKSDMYSTLLEMHLASGDMSAFERDIKEFKSGNEILPDSACSLIIRGSSISRNRSQIQEMEIIAMQNPSLYPAALLALLIVHLSDDLTEKALVCLSHLKSTSNEAMMGFTAFANHYARYAN